VPTGGPTAWERSKAEATWYDFACRYVDMKWKRASAKYRKDIARALTAAAPAMLAEGRGRPDDAAIRRALLWHAFNTKQSDDAPADVAKSLAWVAHSAPHRGVMQDHDRPTYLQLRGAGPRLSNSGAVGLWGGWGSNPRPADYESAALTS
jgi:hypothetical protein